MRGEFIQEYHAGAGTISSDTKSCNTIWSRNSERYQLRLLLMVFFFNQRVISASNDAPKTISRDRMIAGRSHLSIDRGSEIKIKGTVQTGNLWLLRAIHCSSRGALPTPHSSALPSSLNRQRSTLIVLSLVRLGRRAATFLTAAKPSG